MSQVTEQSVRFQTALASIKLIQASAVLDLTEDDFDFLTSNNVWIDTDRSRSRVCVEVFFFQAEDGIRDYKVTGVQTCALPISGANGVVSSAGRTALVNRAARASPSRRVRRAYERQGMGFMGLAGGGGDGLGAARSEERRGGEECRSRGAPDHLKKKNIIIMRAT